MKHEHTPTDETAYGLYQYRECGATRKNKRGEEWHICDICMVVAGAAMLKSNPKEG